MGKKTTVGQPLDNSAQPAGNLAKTAIDAPSTERFGGDRVRPRRTPPAFGAGNHAIGLAPPTKPLAIVQLNEESTDHRWQQEFDRRSQDAVAGLHHPMLHELMLGMPPMHDSLDADAQIFAERLLSRLLDDGVHEGNLVDRLQALTLAPTRDACLAAAVALEEAWRERSTPQGAFLAEASGRCDYYSAAKNSHAGGLRTAGRALAYAHDEDLPEAAQIALMEAAVGWLARTGWDLSDVIERLGPEQGGPAVRRAAELGREVLRRISFLLEARC